VACRRATLMTQNRRQRIFWRELGAHLGTARKSERAGHILGHVATPGYGDDSQRPESTRPMRAQTFPTTDSASSRITVPERRAKEGGQSLLVSALVDLQPDARNARLTAGAAVLTRFAKPTGAGEC